MKKLGELDKEILEVSPDILQFIDMFKLIHFNVDFIARGTHGVEGGDSARDWVCLDSDLNVAILHFESHVNSGSNAFSSRLSAFIKRGLHHSEGEDAVFDTVGVRATRNIDHVDRRRSWLPVVRFDYNWTIKVFSVRTACRLRVHR